MVRRVLGLLAHLRKESDTGGYHAPVVGYSHSSLTLLPILEHVESMDEVDIVGYEFLGATPTIPTFAKGL